MSVWMVRAGRNGEYEERALEEGSALVGWRRVPDLCTVATRDALEEVLRRAYPEVRSTRIKSHACQLWTFRERIRRGDLIVLPLTNRSAIAVGEITGSYEFRSDAAEGPRHARSVRWLRRDIPRTAFDRDLLYSLGAMLTVCRIRRDGAEERIRQMLDGNAPAVKSCAPDGSDDSDSLDIERVARDRLLGHIGWTFKGHAMANLVDAVLRAQGYLTRVSPPGPDGGVDILAGTGLMGFDAPRLCVQVKSGASPVGVKVLRELRGTMQHFHADQGLLVSWGGFNANALAEARSSFFSVRLWDSGDLLAAILDHYDKMPDELQAVLPLKCIWVLVEEP